MQENIIFYVVFLSQIILLSFYYPMRLLDRMQKVLETYPPKSYPKLYLKPIEYFEKRQSLYRIINLTILMLGLVILCGVIYSDYYYNADIQESVPFIYFMLQTFPLMVMEISGFTYFKLMRKADIRTTRKANLTPRRLFDFISPAIVSIAIFLNIASMIYTYIINDYILFGDTLIIIVSLIASNTLFAGIIYWNIYGKKQDPYQDSEDRIRQIEVTIKSLVSMSIAAALFLSITITLDKFKLDFLEPTAMSLYLQLIVVIGLGALLRKLRLENINFDVYKIDPNESTNISETSFQSEESLSAKYTIWGLILGLILGSALGILVLIEGGTVNGFALPAGIGLFLGTMLGAFIDFKKSTS